MIKRAFTLIEVIISIFLLTLVVFALYKNLNIVKKSTIQLHTHLENSQKDIKSYKLLYLDLLQMTNRPIITSKEKNYDRVCFFSKNSLYGLSKAYICWAVHKRDNKLLRVESTKKFILPPQVDTPLQIDIIKKDIKIFKVYIHKKENQLLVYIKDKKEMSFKVKAIGIAKIVDSSSKNKKINETKKEPVKEKSKKMK